MKCNLPDVQFDHAKIRYRNFAGREKKAPSGKIVNSAGSRNFCIDLAPDIAQQMLADGWNVICKTSEEFEEPLYYIMVKVRFDKYPPKVMVVTGGQTIQYNEAMLESLDYADLADVKALITPSAYYRDDGSMGITAYLKIGYFIFEEDPWAAQYATPALPTLEPMA